MQAGLQPKYKMLHFKRIEASREVADNLQIEEGAPVIAFSRVMSADDVPLVVEHTRLPYDLFQNIEEQDLEEPLYLLMREKFQMSVLYTEHELGCVIPSGQDSKLLHLADGEPFLALYIISRDSHGRVVEYSNSLHRDDKYRFKCTIQQYILSNLKNGVKHD
jgi:GntR family transcriptional regulator